METPRNVPATDAPYTHAEDQDPVYDALRAVAQRLARSKECTDLRPNYSLTSRTAGPSSSEIATRAQPTMLSAGAVSNIDTSVEPAGGDMSTAIHVSSANNTNADTSLGTNSNTVASTLPASNMIVDTPAIDAPIVDNKKSAMVSSSKRKYPFSQDNGKVLKRRRVCLDHNDVGAVNNDVHEVQPRPSPLLQSVNEPTHSLDGGQSAFSRAIDNGRARHINPSNGADSSECSTGQGVIRGNGGSSRRAIAERLRTAVAASLPNRSRALLHARQRLRGQSHSFAKRRDRMQLNLQRQLYCELSKRNKATSRLCGTNLAIADELDKREAFCRNRLWLKKWALAAMAKRARKEMRTYQQLRANNRSVDNDGSVNSPRPAGQGATRRDVAHTAADGAKAKAPLVKAGTTSAITQTAATSTAATSTAARTATTLTVTAYQATAIPGPSAAQPQTNRPAQSQTESQHHRRRRPTINMAPSRAVIEPAKMAELERRMFGNDLPEAREDTYGVHESPEQSDFMEEYGEVVRQYPWIMRRRQRLGTREATTNTLLIDRKYYALLRITTARAKTVANYSLEKELRFWFKASDWKVNVSHDVESEDGNIDAIVGVDESAFERAET
ncbi:hypothetical protein IW146_005191 [Coemansia sp. RSA 922]|nr:hypothetical protein GGI08_001784 [Coemansia sp. S2]KAJ2071090.1 hypothetical protein GGH13_003587 [Coemansia sp. S155-1]KAJ2111666.1 hypothetical protein IW146_005191 [Coemansia sp. RSA 922]